MPAGEEVSARISTLRASDNDDSKRRVRTQNECFVARVDIADKVVHPCCAKLSATLACTQARRGKPVVRDISPPSPALRAMEAAALAARTTAGGREGDLRSRLAQERPGRLTLQLFRRKRGPSSHSAPRRPPRNSGGTKAEGGCVERQRHAPPGPLHRAGAARANLRRGLRACQSAYRRKHQPAAAGNTRAAASAHRPAGARVPGAHSGDAARGTRQTGAECFSERRSRTSCARHGCTPHGLGA